MSNTENKLKNSTRRFRDEVAIKKQQKIAKAHGMTNKDAVVKQPHRLNKHHAMDCGDPGCMLCGNPRRNKMLKTKDRLTTQERRMFQDPDEPNDKHSNGLKPDE